MFIVTFFIVISGLIVRNYHLAKVLFYDWDEGMYAQIAKEIINNKSLFTTFNGHIWLDKPPFVHGLIALVFLIFGHSEFWARMIMVCVSFLLLVLTYLLARKITKGKTIASLLPVLILSASPIFLERATMLNSDIFVAVGWLGYFLFWDKFWPKLFFLTLGVWSKSILGFYPLIFDLFNVLIHWLINKKNIKINRKTLLKNLLLIIIPSLWYIAGYIKYGWFFIDNHFLSQVLKRLYVPIELHFGGKFFYLNYLWQNLGIINFLFILAYVLILIELIQSFRKRSWNIFISQTLFGFLVFFFPLPFLALLTLMKTKITWYVILFLPFLTLLISYLYAKIKFLFLKILMIVGVVAYFLINFLPQTFFQKINYAQPEKLQLAKCLRQEKNDKIAFLVDEEERKIKNFLEAAHYNTTSSFFYGGSPSFVYYVQKKVDYYYSIDKFLTNINNYQIFALSKTDVGGNDKLKLLSNSTKTICDYGNWLGVVK